MEYVKNFAAIGMVDLPTVGGKNASLGEMINQLSDLGIQVPKGFATTAAAYQKFLQQNKLITFITEELQAVDVDDVQQLQQVSLAIRERVLAAEFEKPFIDAVSTAYQTLNLKSEQTVAVRSSATAEDLPQASFAGLQETYLNVSGVEAVCQAIKRVYASLFTERAIAYRVHQNFSHEEVAISVGVQRMVRADLACSGVIFTLDTESGFDDVIFITAAYGLGETVVQGAVNPDEFYVHKPTLAQGYDAIVSRGLGTKAIKAIYAQDNQHGIENVDVDLKAQQTFCLTDDEILALAKQAMIIETHYGKPMDIEWAKDGLDNQLYIIQARPETVRSHESRQIIEQYQLTDSAEPIVSGRSIGQKIGQGVARIITDPQQKQQLKRGEILVADMTDPDWEPIMKKAAAIVTNRGGRTCHAAIVARELGIPSIVGCGEATTLIKAGAEVTVSCAEGETGYVYPGLLKYEVQQTKIDNLPTIPVKLCLNLANPEQAFRQQFLPNEGIGLARLEFIISNMIGVHPNAILKFAELDPALQQQIQVKMGAYASPNEFYIEKLAEGVATIAAAFFPKPIIVRFSDFKSNEYANLLGGKTFEPAEENPMLGYRGASRYLADDFAPCFAMECEAIKRVRERKGLTNTHVMFPFVRTIAEAKALIEVTSQHGLVRAKDGLQMYMMCEIPSNALLAEQFLQYFDGYSIGSNDLTQLTLGLDRDSELIAELFDERDAAVKKLLQEVISTCRRMHKYVGICGQGPSDHLDLAEWLMAEGIDSLSLSPDSIVRTWLDLAEINAS